MKLKGFFGKPSNIVGLPLLLGVFVVHLVQDLFLSGVGFGVSFAAALGFLIVAAVVAPGVALLTKAKEGLFSGYALTASILITGKILAPVAGWITGLLGL